jgi:hypothetical protein
MMVSKTARVLAVLATVALCGVVAQADDEFNGKKVKRPAGIIAEYLDEDTQTIITYYLPERPKGMSKEELANLPATERKERIEAFLKRVEEEGTVLGTRPVAQVDLKKDDASTAACGWRRWGWGGWRWGGVWGWSGGWVWNSGWGWNGSWGWGGVCGSGWWVW